MSISQLHKAFNLMKENFSNDEIVQSGPKNEEDISTLEQLLHIKLPLSYKYFIKTMGFGGPNSLIIYGVINENHEEIEKTGIGYVILQHRKARDLPDHLIPLSDIGDGSYYALDLSQMNNNNECPVVVWPLNGYEDTPVLEIVAPDFGAWFLEQVEQQIALKNG